jgi:D-psicose/D-tagatose/L-ribulose 3-epimerase
MRIAVSNLAWHVSDNEAIATLLNKHRIDAIDVAPGKYFPDIGAARSSEMGRVRDWWATRGIAITGMQALLFGTTGLNLFGDAGAQAALLAHLEVLCRIGSELGATKLVFGSPKSRDRSSYSDAQAYEMATTFFRRLGDLAGRHGVLFCLEPNPPRYGANFMTTSAETAQVVMAVAHSAIRMQLDTGAIAINGEDPWQVIRDYGALIGHVHASEPDLVVLGDGPADHGRTASALKTFLPDQVVSIEMLLPKGEAPLPALERAMKVAIHHYRSRN